VDAAMDIQRLKQMAMDLWRRGGLDTLVKVMPFGTVPDPRLRIGYCTTLKYVVGRTPAEIESIVGLAPSTKLGRGAEVFTVRPLPGIAEFDLKGYTQTPGGVPTDSSVYVAHAGYPPGLGAPQWDLARVQQSRLLHLASVPAGRTFSIEIAKRLL
jgi:hypothetical protein